jgi:Ca-activated chloride channel homolog
MKHLIWGTLGVGVVGLISGCAMSSGESDAAPASGYTAPRPVVIPRDPSEPPQNPNSQRAVNPFVVAQHDPLSTFAADVDTASYDIFTSTIAKGALPPAETVRLEEFVNYFRYEYTPPAATAEHPFAISLAAAPELQSNTLVFRVGIRGRLPEVEKRPANLVFLVDTSGSMADPNKLPLVQYTLTQALAVLDPTDTISIVTYAGSTAVRLSPTPVAQAAEIEDVIAGLTSGGGTNGSSGINLAYEQAQAGFIDGGINHVLLCTDGDFNLGITSDEALVQLITERRKSGITLTALGYGSLPNDSMMERVSNAGNGTYAVIYSKGQARQYVETRLLSGLDYIAKDVKIQVEFNPEKVYAYRLLGYEDRNIADDDFRDDVVDAGEVGAGHRVTALYQVVLVGDDLPAADAKVDLRDGAPFSGSAEVNASDYALVKVRYKAPDATEQDPALELSESLTAAAIAEDWSELDSDFQWAYAVATFAEVLKGSPYAGREYLSGIEQMIMRPEHDGIAEREEFRASFERARPLVH